MVQVNFGNFKEYDVNNRFFNPNLAVLTTMTPLETGVDESSGILLQNKDMEIVIISLTMRA